MLKKNLLIILTITLGLFLVTSCQTNLSGQAVGEINEDVSLFDFCHEILVRSDRVVGSGVFESKDLIGMHGTHDLSETLYENYAGGLHAVEFCFDLFENFAPEDAGFELREINHENDPRAYDLE